VIPVAFWLEESQAEGSTSSFLENGAALLAMVVALAATQSMRKLVTVRGELDRVTSPAAVRSSI